MEQRTSIDIDAPVSRAWSVLRNVERWAEWTASVRSVSLLDDDLRVGARARVDQPRIPTTVWTVTDLVEGREFTWEARGPGTVTTGVHAVEATGPDTCRATLSITQSGWAGAVLGRGYRSLTERYLAMEAEGLKRRSEAAAPGPKP